MNKENKNILLIKTKIKKIKELKKASKGLYSSLRIGDILDEEINHLLNEIKQLKCNHSETTGLVYIGHDSHKDYYEDRCIKCDIILERERI